MNDQFDGHSETGRPQAQPTHEMSLLDPDATKVVVPPRNWVKRWWAPDPRKAPREPVSGVAAYYWNGAPPKPREVRDVSATGLYVVTEERWYPGTLVLMTLQNTEGEPETSERSISVQTRAVRWGKDGVGLQFVVSPEQDTRRKPRGEVSMVKAADKKQLEQFLMQLQKGKK
jgi:hypothetical protein